MAISGTHDTETIAEWWDSAAPDERARVAELPLLRKAGVTPDSDFSAALRDALLGALFAAGSDLLLIPVQDIFGWRDRINTPAVVNDDNWCWQLPWRVDQLEKQPEAVERAGFLRQLAASTNRLR